MKTPNTAKLKMEFWDWGTEQGDLCWWLVPAWQRK